jgi:hypothetical protein
MIHTSSVSANQRPTPNDRTYYLIGLVLRLLKPLESLHLQPPGIGGVSDKFQVSYHYHSRLLSNPGSLTL